LGERVRLDDAPRRIWPAHRLVKHIEHAALADGAQDGAQHDWVDGALGKRGRIEGRQHAQHRVVGREDAEVDEAQFAEKRFALGAASTGHKLSPAT
jgi:hypothetical protein